MIWPWLVIGIGALVIVTRAPLLFRPLETVAFYRRWFATDVRVRVMGALWLAVGLAFFGASAEVSGGLRQAFGLLGILLLAITTWAFFAPAGLRGALDRIFAFLIEAIDPAALRALGFIAVCIGGLLVTVGVQAL